MLTNPQKSLLKRAQRAAAIHDAEYRDTLESIAGVRTCTDPRLNDRHLDKLMGLFEGFYWREIDLGRLPRLGDALIVFARRGYWKEKNSNTETSRDRFAQDQLDSAIALLEHQLKLLGHGDGYLISLRRKIPNPIHYRAALRRTLASKSKSAHGAPSPRSAGGPPAVPAEPLSEPNPY
jgi:hypothetical protein